MKNLIKWALILSLLALLLDLLQYGMSLAEIYLHKNTQMFVIWPASILVNGVPILLISYVLLKQQSRSEPKQDFNKQGYKK